MGRVYNLIDAHILREACGDRIDRMRECACQSNSAVALAVIVGGRPAVDIHRLVVPCVPRAHAVFDGSEIDERLEGGARLPFCLCRTIESTLVVITAAHRI